ncbi:choloylglycine hydrolase family protein [Enterococcus bulliens]
MCTSFTLQDADTTIVARTMDFGFELDGRPVVFPKNYLFHTQLGHEISFPYGFMGTGNPKMGDLLADGINEHGVTVMELYFPNEAIYADQPDPQKTNLAPHEFLMWVLGTIDSVATLRQKLDQIQLVALKNPILQVVLPLHFIVSDETGDTIVLESSASGLHLKENPVRVMTNSPELEWHLKNLNNYIGLQTQNFSNSAFNEFTAHPFGQGSGTFGLPGGFTGPERFVRMAFLRANIQKNQGYDALLTNTLSLLETITIPKGVNVKNDGSIDYTQYKAFYDTKKRSYFFRSYTQSETYQLTLTEELLSLEQPKDFPITQNFITHIL